MIPIAKPYISKREKQLVMEVLDSGMLVQYSHDIWHDGSTCCVNSSRHWRR